MLFVFSCNDGTEAPPGDVSLFAAASTTGIVNALAARYERQSGARVTLSVASSGTLARQIEAGAAADLFLSASPEWTRYLSDRGLSDSTTEIAVMENRLVAVAPVSTPRGDNHEQRIDPRRVDGRLAMGDPAHVPAGKYAVQALKQIHFYSEWRGRLLPTQNVLAALRAVEIKACDLGIVYLTNALESDLVNVVYTFPSTSHSPIRYVATALNGHRPGAASFLAFLVSDEARGVITSFGFGVPQDPTGLKHGKDAAAPLPLLKRE